MIKTLIAIATYNEIGNLPELVDAIGRTFPGAHLLVIDDNSPDGTGRWCLERKESDPLFNCMIRPGKLGLGTAVQAAMQYAIGNEYDFLINMDADFSHDPAVLPQLLAAMQDGQNGVQYDVAIGSRYVPGGKIEGWPFHRRLMSRCINRFAKICLGLRTRDNSGAFRCYRVATLDYALSRIIAEGKIRSKGYSFFEEILFLLSRHAAKMIEIPITFVDRKHGSSKINTWEAVKAVGIMIQLSLTRLWPFKNGKSKQY